MTITPIDRFDLTIGERIDEYHATQGFAHPSITFSDTLLLMP